MRNLTATLAARVNLSHLHQNDLWKIPHRLDMPGSIFRTIKWCPDGRRVNMNPHVYDMYQLLRSARLSSPRCSVTISGARDGGAAAEWQSAALDAPSKALWALVDAAAPLKQENMLSYCPSPYNMIRRMQCIINWCKEWRMLPRNEERPVIMEAVIPAEEAAPSVGQLGSDFWLLLNSYCREDVFCVEAVALKIKMLFSNRYRRKIILFEKIENFSFFFFERDAKAWWFSVWKMPNVMHHAKKIFFFRGCLTNFLCERPP